MVKVEDEFVSPMVNSSIVFIHTSKSSMACMLLWRFIAAASIVLQSRPAVVLCPHLKPDVEGELKGG